MHPNKNAGVKTPTVSPDLPAWQKGYVTKRPCDAMAWPPEPPQGKAVGSPEEAESNQSLESGHGETLDAGARGSKASLVTVERAGAQASRG